MSTDCQTGSRTGGHDSASAGEVVVHGPNIMRGYRCRLDETAGWRHAGDAGLTSAWKSWRAAVLEVSGRSAGLGGGSVLRRSKLVSAHAFQVPVNLTELAVDSGPALLVLSMQAVD